jgi:hypothetical protein
MVLLQRWSLPMQSVTVHWYDWEGLLVLEYWLWCYMVLFDCVESVLCCWLTVVLLWY